VKEEAAEKPAFACVWCGSHFPTSDLKSKMKFQWIYADQKSSI
jgi:hypothetical protein